MHPKRFQLTPRRRAGIAVIVVAFLTTTSFTVAAQTTAAYTDNSSSLLQGTTVDGIGINSPFALEVQNSEGSWVSASSPEATASVVSVSDPDAPAGDTNKSLLTTVNVKIPDSSPVAGRITPVIQPPAGCTDKCASMYDYFLVSAAWDASPIATDLTVDEFNSLSSRSLASTPGAEHTLTITTTVAHLPLTIYNGSTTRIGVVFEANTDASL